MMIGFQIKSNEINTSEHLRYIPYGHGKGLYYENLGPTKIIRAEYKLVTYFSLKTLYLIKDFIPTTNIKNILEKVPR